MMWRLSLTSCTWLFPVLMGGFAGLSCLTNLRAAETKTVSAAGTQSAQVAAVCLLDIATPESVTEKSDCFSGR